MFRLFRKYLATGLLFWVPLIITFLVIKILVDLFDRTIRWLPPAYQPRELFGFDIPGLGIVVALVVLIATGVLVANFFGRQFVTGWERLLSRIPIVRSIYSGAKQVTETILSDTGKSFRKVLLVEYPRKGLWSLCFQTATTLGEVQAKTGSDVICCFVPTTPNPTSGFIIMPRREDVIELDMQVDEAIRMIISLGVLVPKWKGEAQVPLSFEEEAARTLTEAHLDRLGRKHDE